MPRFERFVRLLVVISILLSLLPPGSTSARVFSEPQPQIAEADQLPPLNEMAGKTAVLTPTVTSLITPQPDKVNKVYLPLILAEPKSTVYLPLIVSLGDGLLTGLSVATGTLSFDGTNDIVRTVNLPLLSTFTIEAWVKRTADSDDSETFLSDANSDYSQVMFDVFIDGGNDDCSGAEDQFAFSQFEDDFTQCSGVTAEVGQWHHIAISKDGSDIQRFFVDGILRATETGVPDLTNSNGTFTFGRPGSYNDFYFAGLLDEVRLSNIAIYTNTFSPPVTGLISTTNTVGLWHLDEGSGQTAGDTSGNGRNGTLGSSGSSDSADPAWTSGSPVGNNLVLPIFGATPLAGSAPLTVTFVNNSVNATSYAWNFGNGNTSTVVSPTQTYTQAGVYTVSLTAGNGVMTETRIHSQYITVYWPPTPAPFPATSVLDNFNRANGGIGGNWSSATSGYSISSNRLNVGTGQDIFWDTTSFGSNQEVYVTITTMDDEASEMALILKAQSNDDWEDGLLEVLYDPDDEEIEVMSYESGQDWVEHGPDIPLDLDSGDQLGARATANGQVEVYHNGILIASRLVTSWPYYDDGGYVGLWFVDAGDALLDDFGGGNIPAAPVANFAGSPLSGSTPLTVTFVNSSTNATSYLWNFGDTFTSTVISPTHAYTQAGVYTVSLKAIGPSGNHTLTKTNYITAASAGLTISKIAPLSAIVGEPITYTLSVTNSGGLTATNLVITDSLPAGANYVSGGSLNGQVISWTVASLAPGSNTTAQFVVTATGTITNSNYRVTAAGGITAIGQPAVVTLIYPSVLVDFAASPLTGTAPLTVTFANSSTGAISYLWAFGDTFTSTEVNPTHSYTQAGVYTVILTATGLSGSLALTRSNYITVSSNTSLAFDGNNDRLRTVNLPLLSTFTIEAWVKRTADTNDYETILSDANSDYSETMFGLYVDGADADCDGASDQFAYYQGADGFIQCSGIAADLGMWHHLAVSKDSNDTQRFFVDGVLLDTETNVPDLSNSDALFTFGRAGAFAGQYFGGLLDEVRVSNIAIYTATFTPPLSQLNSTTNTVGLWHLNEGSGQTATDSSSNGYTGTLGSSGSSDSADPAWSTDSPIGSNPMMPIFTAAPLTGTTPLTVTFANHSLNATTYLWKFGDNTSSTATSPTHTYTQTGSYTITLSISNGAVTKTQTKTHYVSVSPQGEINLVEVGDTWHYFRGIDAPPVNWARPGFDDGDWLSGPTGIGYGDGDDATELGDMVGGYLTVFARKVFTLENVSTLTGLFLEMDYDDGFVAYLNGTAVVTQNVTSSAYNAPTSADHEAGTVVTYNLSSQIDELQPGVNVLAVQGHNNELYSSDFSLIPALRAEVGSTPAELEAAFIGTPINGSVPLTVTFSNSSLNTTNYVWNFGDGFSSTAISPTYTYTQPGTYTVILTASNGLLTDTRTYSQYIVATWPTQIITLSVITSSDDAWYWTDGEDSDYDDNDSSFVIGTSGGDNPELQIAGWRFNNVVIPAGAEILSAQMSLVKEEDEWLNWQFDWYAETTANPPTFSESNTPEDRLRTSTSIVHDDDIQQLDGVRYSLDQIRSVVQEVVNRPGWASGHSLVILARTDGPGFAEKIWRTYDDSPGDAAQLVIKHTVPLTTSPQVLEAMFSAAPLTGTTPLTVTFVNSSTGATDYLWDFGDSITDTVISPTHTYTQAGVYTVTLHASAGAFSNTMTRSNYISVSTAVIADFVASPLTGTVPLTVTFVNSSTNATNYLWDFGDTLTSTVISPTHVYTQSGFYTVTLTAGNGALTQTVTQSNYINTFAADGLIDSSGGVITSTDGKVVLAFAPGAVTETLDIFIELNNLTEEYTHSYSGTIEGVTTTFTETLVELPSSDSPLVTFNLSAEQPDGTPKVDLQFQAPVTLTYLYSSEEITGLAESTLALFYYNPISKTLDEIPTTIYSETLQLTGVITHFSTYGVGGEKATWTAPAVDAFSVSLAKGSASYSYDIPLPAGPTGFAPKLTLGYNSGIVNGLFGEKVNPDNSWVGTGWSLELGQITWQYGHYNKRTGHTYYNYNLTLNGASEQLIDTNPNSTSNPFDFRTMHRNFMHIQAPPGASVKGNPEVGTWVITDTSGTTYYFGGDGPDNPNSNGTLLAYWARAGRGAKRTCLMTQVIFKLYKVVDAHGNTMEIEYAPVSGVTDCHAPSDGAGYDDGPSPQSFPTRIKYTTNNAAGDSLAEYQVEFVVSDKGYPADSTRARQGDISKKLDRINFWHYEDLDSPSLIRQLAFTYTTAVNIVNQQNKHVLTGLQIVGSNGTSKLPPTTFTYVDLPVTNSWIDNHESSNAANWRWVDTVRWRPFLNTVTNGYGATIDYDYKLSPDNRFQIVDSRHITDTITDLAGTYKYQYSGENIQVDRSDLGDPDVDDVQILNYGRFYGFSQVNVTDPLAMLDDPAGSITKHYFYNGYDPHAFPDDGPDILNGREYQTWTYRPDGKLYSVSWSDWQVALGYWYTYFVYNQEQRDYQCNGTTSGTDLSGCVLKKTSFEYEVNETGNLLKQVEYDPINGNPYRWTEYAYTPNTTRWLLNLPYQKLVKDSSGIIAETRFHYDGAGYQAAPTTGNLTLQQERLSADTYINIAYNYDVYGNAILATSYDGYNGSGTARQTRTGYDLQGLLPISTTNSLNQSSQTSYDYRYQKPLTQTDPNGQITTSTYDTFGRIESVRLPGCNDNIATFKAQYSDTNVVAFTSTPYREVVEQRIDGCGEGGDYTQTYVYYDGFGRKIQARVKGDNTNFIVSDVKYDILGRTTDASVPAEFSGSSFNQPSSVWDADNVTHSEYDVLGRVIEVRQPDGATTVSNYLYQQNTLQTGVIDPKGHMKISQNDLFGRLIKLKEFEETYTSVNWSVTPYATTSYIYDTQDNLKEVIDAQGNKTILTYDRLKRKTEMVDPDMGHWYYRYDARGNLIMQIDAKQRATHMYYDALNRLQGKTYHAGPVNPTSYTYPGDPGSSHYTLEYRYDQNDAGHGAGIGRRTQMIDLAGTVDWHYDGRGRVLTETRQFSGPYNVLTNTLSTGAYVTAYRYNEADWVTRLTYPDGEVVATDYTDRGLPDTLTGNLPGGGTATYITEANYNALANLTSRIAGGVLTTTYGYYSAAEDLNRLENIRVGNDLLNLTYQYDAVGNISSLTDTSTSAGPGETLSFDYDPLNRLTSAERSSGQTLPAYDESYFYDSIGNLIKRNDQTRYQYPNPGQPRPHAVQAVGDNTYAYDANGNMITRLENGITYSQTWNYDNKLQRITWRVPGATPGQPGQPYTTTFVYDGDGNRLLKIEREPGAVGQGIGEVTTVYIGQIYEEQFKTTNLTTSAGQIALISGEAEGAMAWAAESERIEAAIAPRGTEAVKKSEPGLDETGLAQTAALATTQPLTFTLSRPQMPLARPAGLAVPLPPAAQDAAMMTPVAIPLVQDIYTKTWDIPIDFQGSSVVPVVATGMDSYDIPGNLRLLSLNDKFDDNLFNLNRWYYGWGVINETGGKLTRFDNSPTNDFGVGLGNYLKGDFIVQLKYGLTSWPRHLGSPRLGLLISCESNRYVQMSFSANNPDTWPGNYHKIEAWMNSDNTRDGLRRDTLDLGTLAATGTLQVERRGITWTLRYKVGPQANFTDLLVRNETQGGGSFGDCFFSLGSGYWTAAPPVAYGGYFDDMQVLKNNGVINWTYVSNGAWQSVAQASASPNDMVWRTLAWNGSLPVGTSANFQVRSCTSANGGCDTTWQTIGMTGNSGSVNLPPGLGRNPNLQVRVNMASNGDNKSSPLLNSLAVSYLVDTTPPTVPPPQATLRAISPNNDGYADTTTITASIGETYLKHWTLGFKQNGQTYRTITGTTTSVNQVWDGKRDNGQVAPDGPYTVTLTATNQVSDVVSRQTEALVVVDTQANIQVISPTNQLMVSVPQVAVIGSRDPGITVTVNSLVLALASNQPIFKTVVPLVSGTNVITITGQDYLRNKSVITRTVIYDPQGPSLANWQPTGVISTTRPVISASFLDGFPSNIISHTVRFDGQIITSTLTGFSYTPSTNLADGSHTVSVKLTDASGHTHTQSWLFDLDTTTWGKLESPLPQGLVNTSPLTVSGQAETDAEVALKVGGTPVGITTAPEGHFSLADVTLAEGVNTLTLIVTDTLANVSEIITTVTLATDRPAGMIGAVPAIFSPNSDGFNDETQFMLSADPPEEADLQAWTLDIRNTAGLVRQWSGSDAPPGSQSWDGSDGSSIVADGDYTYTLALTATNGLTSVTPVQLVTLDSQPPLTPTITAPVSGTSVSNIEVQVTGTAEANTRITIYSGVFTATVPVNQAGNWSVWLPLESGQNLIRAKVTDAAGQLSPASIPVLVWLTVNPPLYTVAIAPDIAGLGTTLVLTATARGINPGEGPPTAAVTATVPSGAKIALVQLAPTNTLTSTWRITWTVENAVDGLHAVSFLGIDTGGNSGGGDTALVVDSQAPYPPWLDSPRDPQGERLWVGQAQVIIRGDRADPGDQINLFANGTLTGTTTTDANRNWQVAPTLAEGQMTLQARATDWAGNQSSFSNSSLLGVDLTPPTVTFQLPSQVPLSIDLTWQGSDPSGSGQAGSGVRSYEVQYKVGNGDWTGLLTRTTLNQTSFAGSKGFTYTFQVRATDNVGRTGNWVVAGPVTISPVTKYYLHGGNRVAMRQGSVVYYLHGDHLGSVSLTTDASGALVSQSRYLPYGQERWSSGSTPTDFGFTSQREESGFGLMDYNARYYSPYLGRFISPDTVIPNPADGQTFNRYAYVNNNPVKYTDPTGHILCKDGQGVFCKNPIQFKPVDLGSSGNKLVDSIRNLVVNIGCGLAGGSCEVENNILQPTDDATYVQNGITSAGLGMVVPLKPTSALAAASKLVKGGLFADEAADLANTIATQSTHRLRDGGWATGEVVSLGHWRSAGGQPGYIDWAKSTGATYFDMAEDVYGTIKGAEGLSWNVNERFLDQAIDGGAQFRLQIPDPAPTTGFGREIQYLTEKGFKKVNEGGEWWMKR